MYYCGDKKKRDKLVIREAPELIREHYENLKLKSKDKAGKYARYLDVLQHPHQSL